MGDTKINKMKLARRERHVDNFASSKLFVPGLVFKAHFRTYAGSCGKMARLTWQLSVRELDPALFLGM